MHRLLVTSVVFVAFCSCAADALAAACEDLVRLNRPGTTVSARADGGGGRLHAPCGRRRTRRRRRRTAVPKLPAFCRVAATLAPSSDSDIKVEVWLPASGWNGKLQAVGNGGMAGTIPYPAMAAALAAGYATAGTDTGHVGNNADFMPGHPEKLVDFGYRAIHEMAVAAKAIVQTHYGGAPKRSYFNGCSQGGRQGITSAQRYPEDFDGIVAGASAWNQMRMHGARMSVNRIMNRTPESAIPASKYPAIHEAVLLACDARDGVKDGVIENPTACTVRLQLTRVQGRGHLGVPDAGADRVGEGDGVAAEASDHRRRAVRRASLAGRRARVGHHRRPRATAATPSRRSRTSPIPNDRELEAGTTFNMATDVESRAQADKGLLRSDNANLKPFFDRGGKLLMWHGWADPQVTPQTSTIYYNNVLKTVGQPGRGFDRALHAAGRLPLPGRARTPTPSTGWAHSSSGSNRATKPTRIIASKLQDGKVVRTRPLCPFGQVAKWNGTGSTDDAANFACVAETMDTSVR